MEKSMEHRHDAQSSSLRDFPAESKTSHNATDSKDSKTDDIDEITTKAIEVNSADEVRQAIKAVLSGKPTLIQNEGTDSTNQATDKTSEDIKFSISQKYKPESGDQLLVPQQENSRKRRGGPHNTGPSKRSKKRTVEDFYVGKLSNVVTFPSFNRKRRRPAESESDESVYTPYTAHQWLRMRYYR